MSGKYRDGIDAQADYMRRKGAKEAARGRERVDGRWVDVDRIPDLRPLIRVHVPFEPPPLPPPDRGKQIRDALWFGLRPSWMYEREPHYDCGYLRHAAMNVALAWRWATRRETAEDIEFASETR